MSCSNCSPVINTQNLSWKVQDYSRNSFIAHFPCENGFHVCFIPIPNKYNSVTSPSVTAPASADLQQCSPSFGQQEELLQAKEIKVPLPKHLTRWQIKMQLLEIIQDS